MKFNQLIIRGKATVDRKISMQKVLVEVHKLFDSLNRLRSI